VALIVVNERKCQGHGRCALVAPDYFDIGDDGVVKLLRDEVVDADLNNIQVAVSACPESALELDG
jgi:ferredoxin